MTYKIDKQLPWFSARSVLKEDMYVNIVATSYSDELNPNGLFSGFLSNQVFYTSRWDGYNFTALEIPLDCVEEVLFLEYLDKPKKEKKNFRQDSQENKSNEDILEELKKFANNPQENIIWKTSPDTKENYTKIYKDLEKSFKDFPKIILGDGDLESLFTTLMSQSKPKDSNKTK